MPELPVSLLVCVPALQRVSVCVRGVVQRCTNLGRRVLLLS